MASICSICHDDNRPSLKQVCVTTCGHLYHYQCLRGWLDIKPTCPECRAAITMASVVPKIYPNDEGRVEKLKRKVEQYENELYFLKEENAAMKAAVQSAGKIVFLLEVFFIFIWKTIYLKFAILTKIEAKKNPWTSVNSVKTVVIDSCWHILLYVLWNTARNVYNSLFFLDKSSYKFAILYGFPCKYFFDIILEVLNVA